LKLTAMCQLQNKPITNMKTNNKSQMETIGITIIVVLVLIGVMFGIQFVLKQEPSEVGTEFRQSQLAANFLNTLAGTTTRVNDLTFTQLVQRCAEESTTCESVRTVAQSILRSTFEPWQNYYFTIKKGGTDLISPLGTVCSGDYQSKSYPIPTRSAGTVTMKLDLC